MTPLEIYARRARTLAQAEQRLAEAAEFYTQARAAAGAARKHLFLRAAELETQGRGLKVLAARDRLDAEMANMIAKDAA